MSASQMSASQFETTLFVYGYQQDGITLARGTALRMAQMSVGTIYRSPDKSSGTYARLVSIRLEDDTPDGSKGRVIGVCEPVAPEPKWQPGPKETK